ncbi:hypothetical protein [Halobacillus sp. K22]|uniref:hypothetical protein n=1 Tax=Halobacillus sp. K22 TaxID=3457431 RepID=UPI003FCE50B0
MKRWLTVLLLGFVLVTGTFKSASFAFDKEKDAKPYQSMEVTMDKFKAHDPGDLGMG